MAVAQMRPDPPPVETPAESVPTGSEVVDRAAVDTVGVSATVPGMPGVGVEAAGGIASEASEALITTRDGSVTRVGAASLSSCISVNHSISLASGQDVPFASMSAIDVLGAEAAEAPNAQARVRITLANGNVIEGRTAANCDVFGYNEVGRYSITWQKLSRIEFVRPQRISDSAPAGD